MRYFKYTGGLLNIHDRLSKREDCSVKPLTSRHGGGGGGGGGRTLVRGREVVPISEVWPTRS